MRLLLDTCSFLWLASDAPELSANARKLIADPTNDVFLSAASIWEIAIKYSRNRLGLDEPPVTLIPKERDAHRIADLPIDDEAALYTGLLPWHHGDPFDRMLVAQAIVHSLILLSPDPLIRQYPVRTIW